MRRGVIVLGAGLLALAGGCRAGGAGAPEEASPGSEGAGGTATGVRVRTAVAARKRFVETVDAIGVVAPRPGAFAALSAPAPGRVARIDVAVGSPVRRGEALVELERAPFDAAAQSAAASLQAAERAYERAQRLAQEGIVPRKEVDQAAATLAEARVAALTTARARELATLRAPIAGVVTRLDAVLGQAVDASRPIVEVADPGAVDVVLSLAPREAARVHVGDPVTLTGGAAASAAAASREPLGDAVVSTIAATVDSATRSVAVRARLAHPSRTLRIGETVFGRIAVAVHPAAVTVPVEALVPEGERVIVFVVDRAGVAHARAVTVGARTESEAEITSGLSAGEVVVTAGAYGVQDSARIVRVMP
jgi:RND family efflux transporter MFP subunit